MLWPQLKILAFFAHCLIKTCQGHTQQKQRKVVCSCTLSDAIFEDSFKEWLCALSYRQLANLSMCNSHHSACSGLLLLLVCMRLYV